MFQAYYDRVDYKSLISNQFKAESFDIDINHRFPLFNRHDVTWGFNYRLYHNKIYDGALLSFIPRDRINQLFSGYIRDEITLIPERLKLTLGTRLDHNDFTGLEVQPNGRLMWTPNEKNSIWLAISRAVRTPSRAENDVLFNYGTQGKPPFLTVLQLNGSPHFNSEKLLAYEAGYRYQLTPQASIDIAAFYNDYSQLRDLTFRSKAG
jgi:iron complex outermembrane receptor protein